MANLRTRKRVVLYKVESTEGVDAAPDATNAITCTEIDVDYPARVQEANEFLGGLGSGAPVITGAPATARLGGNLRGSGVAATAPRIGDLLETAALVEVVASAAIPTTSTTACTGGTATTVTIDRTAGNGADWPSQSGSLIGHPIELAGNPATPTIDFITGYVVAGNIATVTVSTTYSPVLSSSTTIKRLPHVLYKPGSPDPHPSGTLYVYEDGRLRKAFGCRADLTLTWEGAGRGVWAATLNGLRGGDTDTAVLSVTPEATASPPWVGGLCAFDRKLIAASQLTVALGNSGQDIPNPNQSEGFDAYVIGGRSVRGSVNPLLALVATRDSVAMLMAQAPKVFAAMLGKRQGGVTGGRIGLVIPQAMLTAAPHAPDGNVLRETLSFQALGNSGTDEEFYLTFF
jgi:hypothetical protein